MSDDSTNKNDDASKGADPTLLKAPESSPQDDRQYAIYTASSGLTCLLVSDPTTDKASAAMDVRVGHFSDPENVPGLAHFLEHM
jgi:insulysin